MQALERNVKCVALFDEVPNPLTGTAPTRLARLTAERGIAVLEQTWQQVTGDPLPPPVRRYVEAQ
jgi:hypothetical protein